LARRPVEERLGRLLAVVPWVAERDGPLLSEVSRRFGVDPKELAEDLEILFMCGVPPFTPDVLIDVELSDGRVWVRMADYFRRPVRLNAQEALALCVAARAFLALPGSDPEGYLAAALAKLESTLGLRVGQELLVELEPVRPELVSELERAVRQGLKVRLRYYSFGRDRISERVVRPERVYNLEGNWYLRAFCEQAGAQRTFRLDRVERAELTGEDFEPPQGRAYEGPDHLAYHPSPEAALWVLELDGPAQWVAVHYPVEQVRLGASGRMEVSIRSENPAWMERLLLRLGPHVRVLAGDASLAPGAARRVLERYRRSG